jgi:hypothetical protein
MRSKARGLVVNEHNHELRHAREALAGTLVDPCLFSGQTDEQQCNQRVANHGSIDTSLDPSVFIGQYQ